MAVVMPSRFAVLKIEEDDYRPKNQNKTNDIKKKTESKQNQKKTVKITNAKKTGAKPVSSKPPQAPQPAQTKSKKKKEPTAEQWEQWKQKDSEFVNGNYEEDLQNAILLSKLDFEENKGKYKQPEKKRIEEPKNPELSKKNKKKKVMSLEQFNNMVSGVPETNGAGDEPVVVVEENFIEPDETFFDRIKKEAKEELRKEKTQEKRKTREPYNDAVTISQFQGELEKERAENVVLRRELEAARQEILNVKTRNKKLYSILAQGEMKDKAEILTEVERMKRVQEELTAEVARLYEQLEQERSKSGAKTHEPKHKDKFQKKRAGNENTQAKSS